MLMLEFVTCGSHSLKYNREGEYTGNADIGQSLDLDMVVKNELVSEACRIFGNADLYPGPHSAKMTAANISTICRSVDRSSHCAELMVTAALQIERPPYHAVRDQLRTWIIDVLSKWFKDRGLEPPTISVRLQWDD